MYHRTPIRMFPEANNLKGGDASTGTLIHRWWECKMQPTLEESLTVSYKTKHSFVLTYYPGVTHLVQFSSVQFSLSVVSDSATPWTAARQASLSITSSWSLLKLMSIESVMPSNHLILCCPLLLLPSIFPSTRVFSNESVPRMKWPKY